jgi:hypothetical protein
LGFDDFTKLVVICLGGYTEIQSLPTLNQKRLHFFGGL